MKAQRKQWAIAAIAWFAMSIYTLIFREAHQVNVPPPFPHFDKFAHALLFWVQTWLVAKYWLVVKQKPPYFALFVLAVVWAVVSELAQHFFTTTRQGDVFDIAADMLGVVIALQLAHLRAKVEENV